MERRIAESVHVGRAAGGRRRDQQPTDGDLFQCAEVSGVVLETDRNAAGRASRRSQGRRQRPVGASTADGRARTEQVRDPGGHGPLKLSAQRRGVRNQLFSAGRAARRLQQRHRLARQDVRLAVGDPFYAICVILITRRRDGPLVIARGADSPEVVGAAKLRVAVGAEDIGEEFGLALGDPARGPTESGRLAGAGQHPGGVQQPRRVHRGAAPRAAGSGPITR